MAFEACETEATGRYRDLDTLLDYREYDGTWSFWFEELASADANSSYTQLRVTVSKSLRPALASELCVRSCP